MFSCSLKVNISMLVFISVQRPNLRKIPIHLMFASQGHWVFIPFPWYKGTLCLKVVLLTVTWIWNLFGFWVFWLFRTCFIYCLIGRKKIYSDLMMPDGMKRPCLRRVQNRDVGSGSSVHAGSAISWLGNHVLFVKCGNMPLD